MSRLLWRNTAPISLIAASIFIVLDHEEVDLLFSSLCAQLDQVSLFLPCMAETKSIPGCRVREFLQFWAINFSHTGSVSRPPRHFAPKGNPSDALDETAQNAGHSGAKPRNRTAPALGLSRKAPKDCSTAVLAHPNALCPPDARLLVGSVQISRPRQWWSACVQP